MTAVTRPALRYHGGKFRLAPWILDFFPVHKIYVEPFGGGGSVLLLKGRVGAECYNDLDNQVVNIFRVLRDPERALELQRRVALTPFARAEFDWSYGEPADDIDAAHRLIVRSFMGHGSDSATRGCRTGFRAKLTDGRVLPAYEWASWSDCIPAFTRRLAGVLVENSDALHLIPRMDHVDALFYVDPPYVHSTRSSITGRSAKTHGYRFEMDEAAHRTLAAALHAIEGMAIVSGYPSDLYDRELYPTWERFERRAMADSAKVRTEVVWLNPACSDALQRSRGGLFAGHAA
jgi:DNA adenine methylase